MKHMEQGMQVQALEAELNTAKKQVKNYKTQLDEINQTMLEKLADPKAKKKGGLFGRKKKE